MNQDQNPPASILDGISALEIALTMAGFAAFIAADLFWRLQPFLN